MQFNTKKPKQLNKKKWAKDPTGHFSEEGILMAIKQMGRCSESLIIRERQIKSPVRLHLTPVRMAIPQIFQQSMLERV